MGCLTGNVLEASNTTCAMYSFIFCRRLPTCGISSPFTSSIRAMSATECSESTSWHWFASRPQIAVLKWRRSEVTNSIQQVVACNTR